MKREASLFGLYFIVRFMVGDRWSKGEMAIDCDGYYDQRLEFSPPSFFLVQFFEGLRRISPASASQRDERTEDLTLSLRGSVMVCDVLS